MVLSFLGLMFGGKVRFLRTILLGLVVLEDMGMIEKNYTDGIIFTSGLDKLT